MSSLHQEEGNILITRDTGSRLRDFFTNRVCKNNFYLILVSPPILSSVQLLSRVRIFAIPWTTACQASLFITNSWSLPKLMSIELVMPPNHLILCGPLLFLPSIFPSIRVFSNKSALRKELTKILEFQLQHQSFQ